MIDLHVLWLCWGPVLLSFSVAWLIRHPDDWTGPAIIIPVSIVYCAVTYIWAFRWLRTASAANRRDLMGGMIVGPLVGLVLAVLLLTGVLGRAPDQDSGTARLLREAINLGLVAGACRTASAGCSTGDPDRQVTEAGGKLGLELLDDLDDHAGVDTYVREGYELVPF